MNHLTQLRKSEEAFQKWFRQAHVLAQSLNCSASDFRKIGTPFECGEKYAGYEVSVKQAIRVPRAFYDNPDDFMPVLVDYLIDNTRMLYRDSVRIAATDSKIYVYKDCGNQLGGILCYLKREGNLITASVIYQIYNCSMSILSDPSQLVKCSDHELRRTTAWGARCRNRFFIWKRIAGFILICLILLSASASVKIDLAYSVISVVASLLLLFFLTICWISITDGDVFAESRRREKEATGHLKGDLSPIHFPVQFYEKEDVNRGIAKNLDHQVFFEKTVSVIARAVSLAEQSQHTHSSGEDNQ
jgi:hypothetical protein